jgi:Zn-dependent peptidase ImmA (M78 family)
MAPTNFRLIKLGREFRALTQSQLAKAAGIAQPRLSRLETGHTEASDLEVAALADALRVPQAFFQSTATPAAVPLFRKRAIRSVRRLANIQARLNVAVLVGQRLLDAGIEIEPPRLFPDPGEFDFADPRAAAAALRKNWRLPVGAVDNVTGLIESAAGIVLFADFGSDEATAAFIATPTDGRLWFLVNTREYAGDRVRLSLAHELGHAVLHRMLPAYDEGEAELQAFEFATALLLPPDTFDPAIRGGLLTLSDARRMKSVYGVSIQAIVRAAALRGLIGRDRYTSLFKQISARQWRLVEPDALSVEKPHIWPEVIRIHREEHGYSDGELARLADVDESILAELFPHDFTHRELRVVRPAVRPAPTRRGGAQA